MSLSKGPGQPSGATRLPQYQKRLHRRFEQPTMHPYARGTVQRAIHVSMARECPRAQGNHVRVQTTVGGNKMWMVRNGSGDYVDEFLRQGIVAVGWKDAGSLENLKSRKAVIEQVQHTWPESKRMKTVVSGSQLDKIANVMKIGDRAITYDPSKRVYHIGKIVGQYAFDANAEGQLANRRKVVWLSQIERDRLSVPTKNSLGSTLTVFSVPQSAEQEIDQLLNGKTETANQPEVFAANEAEVDVQNLLDDLKSKAREFIKDKIISLDWDEMQQLVAGLLRAMGYKTQVSPPGSDRGKDIIASPDGLGLEQPRIVVEVKHRQNEQMGAGHIRSYLGGRHKDDRGLYVSTGGFSRTQSTKLTGRQYR
jgi:restriction system protein